MSLPRHGLCRTTPLALGPFGAPVSLGAAAPRWLGRSALLGAFLITGCGEPFVATGGAGGGTTQSTTSAGGGAGGQTMTGGSGGTTSPGCAPLKADACNQCLAESCSATYCDCAGKPDCLKLLQCIAEGGPNPPKLYIETCTQQHKNSISLVGNLFVCAGSACDVCGTPTVDACTACQYEKCSAEVNECFSTYDCNAYVDCLADCAAMGNPESCASGCKDAHQSGEGLYNTLVGCATDACQSDCL